MARVSLKGFFAAGGSAGAGALRYNFKVFVSPAGQVYACKTRLESSGVSCVLVAGTAEHPQDVPAA